MGNNPKNTTVTANTLPATLPAGKPTKAGKARQAASSRKAVARGAAQQAATYAAQNKAL